MRKDRYIKPWITGGGNKGSGGNKGLPIELAVLERIFRVKGGQAEMEQEHFIPFKLLMLLITLVIGGFLIPFIIWRGIRDVRLKREAVQLRKLLAPHKVRFVEFVDEPKSQDVIFETLSNEGSIVRIRFRPRNFLPHLCDLEPGEEGSMYTYNYNSGSATWFEIKDKSVWGEIV